MWGAANHKVTSAFTFSQDAYLWSFLPHMHLRGKSFAYQLVLPDGKREVLLSVPRYDFAWQATYLLAKPRLISNTDRSDGGAFFHTLVGTPLISTSSISNI